MSMFERAGAGLSDWLANAPDVAELVKGSAVNLAVTGLSRAGKTVFITSLVHNLLSALHQPHRMPLLKVVGEGRLVAAKLVPGTIALPRFPYESNIERMATSPADWPARTTDISDIEIDIRFVPSGALGFVLGRIGSGMATLRLRIIDYPGEWLLDLPLLSQSYADWSRATLKLCRNGLRAEVARDYLAFLSDHPHTTPASDDDARRAHELYRDYLRAARDEHGFSFLQPGRFLDPGALAGRDLICFAPLDIPEGVYRPADGTFGALMERRFEAYKAEVVTPFYHRHFRNFSRQVVLVDVLGALLAGREVFDDTQHALDAILESFRYGRGGIISRLLGNARIEKVLFAATKADHVPDVQRDHLGSLLRSMIALPALDVRSQNAAMDVTALASVISTEEDTQEIDGQRVQVVVGKPVGSETRAKFFVGNVPAKPPRPELWGKPFLNIPVFEPPAIDVSPIDGIPHMNLDLALDYLIGDRLS
ncbi:YcjX family protein [Pseudolabrys taiwanensis]|nr:YcjX family protein [Pseudolabrys taiwanensis]